MLTVGLTGGLGSGKSTVAAMLALHGAHILSADEIGRALMQAGQPVFDQIVATFGSQVLLPTGQLDRPALARLAFTGGRLEELNAIIHPATIAQQQALAEAIFAADPDAVVVVESALIFETKYGESGRSREGPTQRWQKRFDKLILVTAPDDLKIERFIQRSGVRDPQSADPASLAAEARRRLAQQMSDELKAPQVDFLLRNDSTREALQLQVDALWRQLRAMEIKSENTLKSQD